MVKNLPAMQEIRVQSLCGAAGAGAGRRPGPEFQFPVKWWDSPPPSGNLEPANQYAPGKQQRES